MINWDLNICSLQPIVRYDRVFVITEFDCNYLISSSCEHVFCMFDVFRTIASFPLVLWIIRARQFNSNVSDAENGLKIKIKKSLHFTKEIISANNNIPNQECKF